MAKQKRKKPTQQDFINVINRIIQDVHSLQNDMNAIMGAFDMYVDMNKHSATFKDYIDNKIDKASRQKIDEVQTAGQDNTVANTTDSQNKG
tara:strand:+ start:529 stop:801 length:273 start_codon:yes stop_codon:yes gene_type:complete